MPGIVQILIAASTAFVVLFILSLMLGKKQIAQLDFVDYIVGISIGSIAAEMSTNTETPIYYFIIAMVIFFLFDILVSYLGRKGPLMKKIMKGKPAVIIFEGRLNYENLKKNKLDINDLIVLCREQGYFDLNQIQYALFETSGRISIMPIGAERPAVTKDLPIEISPSKLPNYLIVDGKISYSGLREAGKDKEWLLDKIGISSEKELKNIILASYDQDTDKITSNYK